MTSEVIECANTLGIADMAALYPKLLTWLLEHERLVFDCSQIERIDTAALQMLYAFSKASSIYGCDVSWGIASDIFINNAQLLGLDKGIGVSPYLEDDTQSVTAASPKLPLWDIKFNPDLTSLKIGHDPVLLFQALKMLGELTVVTNDEGLPPFSDMEPDVCYLGWQLMLKADVGEQEIKAIFKQIETECELSIESMTPDILDIEFEMDEANEAARIAVLEPSTILQEVKGVPEKSAMKNAHDLIQVEAEKIETLVNLVGELMSTQSMLSEVSDHFTLDSLPMLNQGIEQLKRHTQDMQNAMTRIRMLPISDAFNRLLKLIDDLALASGKKVNFKLSGDQIDLDKRVLENLMGPLTHLVLNAVDHGIEVAEVRDQAGKPKTGTVDLNVSVQGSNITLKVSDDGAGIDTEKVLRKAVQQGLVSDKSILSPQAIHDLIFKLGISIKDGESNLRDQETGVEAVRTKIVKMEGSIEVTSVQGQGTTFTVRIPLPQAIMDGQKVTVAGQDYILPLTSIIESIEIEPAQVKQVSGKGEIYFFRGDYIPIIRLYQLFNLPPIITQLEQGVLVVVDAEGQKAALFIDDLLSQHQVVMKRLETNYRKVIGFSGATIMGNGRVVLILDPSALMKLYKNPRLAMASMFQDGRIN